MNYLLRTNDMNKAFNNLFAWDSFFPELSRGNAVSGSLVGSTNFWDSDKGYHMEVELPGLSEKEISVELKHRELTISAKSIEERKEENNENGEKGTYYLKERRNRSFTRTFTLPEFADADKLNAVFENGLLTIDIPRKDEAQPKQITINRAINA